MSFIIKVCFLLWLFCTGLMGGSHVAASEDILNKDSARAALAQIFPPEDMPLLDFLTVDDVTIAGAQYTLIFVGSDDVLGWDTYKEYLPAQVARGPASPPTDEAVMAYLDRLTTVAGNNFEVAFSEDFEANKAAYAAEYPDNFTEEQVRESVKSVFEYNNNGENKPEIQQAYNEYAALATLRGGLEFYLTYLKGKKL